MAKYNDEEFNDVDIIAVISGDRILIKVGEVEYDDRDEDGSSGYYAGEYIKPNDAIVFALWLIKTAYLVKSKTETLEL